MSKCFMVCAYCLDECWERSNGAQQAGTIVNETGTGKFAGNIIKVFNYNGIKVAVDDTRKLIMSVRPETGFHLP
ncbi:hypothetical protein GCM10022209_60160 [Chitinophaga oryziterrae]